MFVWVAVISSSLDVIQFWRFEHWERPKFRIKEYTKLKVYHSSSYEVVWTYCSLFLGVHVRHPYVKICTYDINYHMLEPHHSFSVRIESKKGMELKCYSDGSMLWPDALGIFLCSMLTMQDMILLNGLFSITSKILCTILFARSF
jgi:hypothetical protein